jgi:hypothetical protein
MKTLPATQTKAGTRTPLHWRAGRDAQEYDSNCEEAVKVLQMRRYDEFVPAFHVHSGLDLKLKLQIEWRVMKIALAATSAAAASEVLVRVSSTVCRQMQLSATYEASMEESM